MIVFADHFLAGALLSLILPAAVLVAVAIWYVRSVLRLSSPQGEPRQPPRPAQPASAVSTEDEPSGAGTSPSGEQDRG